jgi:hypothetical protein
MITKFELFINESKNYNDERLVRIMSWLYMFLVYKKFDKHGLVESWFKDGRMGIKLEECMPYLKDNKFVKMIYDVTKNRDVWVITKKGENKLYSFFDVPKTREEFMNYDRKALSKYDITGLDGYPISRIPMELYEQHKRDNKGWIKYNLEDEIYEKINIWVEKHQRGLGKWVGWLSKYCGLKEDLLPNVDKMTLYRGLNLSKLNVESIKVGDELVCSNPSWTLDLKVAQSFASGKHGLGDHREMFEDEIGVVLKHEFNYTELFMDMNWVDDNHDFFIDEILFSNEYEVIVKPKKRKYKVFEVFDKNNMPNKSLG